MQIVESSRIAARNFADLYVITARWRCHEIAIEFGKTSILSAKGLEAYVCRRRVG